VGSRMGNSAIGMYVDDVPYIDKTSFDFNLFDISRIEVLRGPQGTLYGRNSMGGLINIYTLSPWNYQGTRFKLSTGSHGLMSAQASHYAKLNEKIAFSVGANYSASGGFYKNMNPDYNPNFSPVAGKIFPKHYDKDAVGAMESTSMRANVGWKPSTALSFNYIGSYEYAKQNGYAYGRYNYETNLPDTIDYNSLALYTRNVLNNSLRVEYQAKNFKIASTTGHQYLNDSLLLDQDFTASPVFTLMQQQKLNAINEEITIRSTTNSNFQWIAGLSGFHQNMETNSEVVFLEDGVTMIQDRINSSAIPFPLTILNNIIPIYGEYAVKNYGIATFLQPTLNNFLTEGLSISAGARLDYEKVSLNHFTHGAFDCTVGPMMVAKNDSIKGFEKMDFTQLLPKLSLRYEQKGNSVYASIAKGYKAGGYNLQMFSDLMEVKMRSMSSVEFDIQNAASFKPEYSWNYEIGGRISFSNRFNAGITVFYLDISDQQIAEFATNGQGRMIKNAGESESKGVEVDVNIFPINGLNIGINYGYTHSVFTKYTEQITNTTHLDYSGKYVPFVPKNTVSLSADYTRYFNNSFINKLTVSGQYSGSGRIYWTEANDVSQKYYSLLNGRISVEKGNLALSIWARNLTNVNYSTFYFKTFGNSFGQLGKPIHFGIDFMCRF